MTPEEYQAATELAVKLDEYAELSSDEWGEYCKSLVYMIEYHTSAMSDEIFEVICKEIRENLEYATDTFNIVEREEVRTYKVRDLEDKYLEDM